MPLDRIVLIAVMALTALAVAVYLFALVIGSLAAGPISLLALIPTGFVVYVAIRVIRERHASEEDKRYDKIEY